MCREVRAPRPCHFNSRPSARGDFAASESPGVGKISIHAPPRGATVPFCVLFSCLLYFNSRPSARGDDYEQNDPEAACISIHAPPRGATRRPAWRTCRNSNDFNSRPSARGDQAFRTSSIVSHLFQFTPLREGRRRRGACGGPAAVISIHAPPRGATTARRGAAGCGSHFNSRPSARGDGCHTRTRQRRKAFQFTPLREGRRFAESLLALAVNFNSRPSARGD